MNVSEVQCKFNSYFWTPRSGFYSDHFSHLALADDGSESSGGPAGPGGQDSPAAPCAGPQGRAETERVVAGQESSQVHGLCVPQGQAGGHELGGAGGAVLLVRR